VSAAPLLELVRRPELPGLSRPPVPSPLTATPDAEIDLDVQTLKLDVLGAKFSGLDTRIENSLVDGSIERTIDGASTLTLTVHDPRRALLQSGMFAHTVEVTLDRFRFRLVKVSKADTDLTLTFEDRDVARLRQYRKPRKASRAKVTRAEFALSLVREVKNPAIAFVCPELHTRQPVSASTSPALALTATTGGAASSDTRERLVDLWKQAGGDPKLAVTMAAIALAESNGVIDAQSPPNTNGTIDRGLWQINSVHGYDAGKLLSDPLYNARAAVAIERSQGLGSWSTWKSGAYKSHLLDAKTAVAREGTAGSADRRTVRKALPYQFRRGDIDGTPEDSWTCLQRLAEEVNWRCFASEGSVYFISETQLMKAAPTLTLTEDTDGVITVDFDVDSGKKAQSATITCRASRWVAAPGAVVKLAELGPADGLWLVSDLRRNLFDAEAEITLKRPTPKLPEPAAETVDKTVSRDDPLGEVTGGQVARAYQAMQAIDARHYPYVWGGGHGAAGVPSHGTGRDPGIGYDCSGSTVAVLAAAGMGFTLGGGTASSGALMSWGAAGPGKHITVYANREHVFMVIDGHHFGTGNWGKGWGGPGFNPNMHPLGGFVARHWPGT